MTAREKTVLFVCTGNVCRSPMAAAVFAHRAGPGSGWRAVSAGTAAYGGMPATREAQLAVAEWKIDLSGHVSQPLTPELVAAADLVVGMTESHRQEVLWLAPGAAGKTFVLTEFAVVGGPAGVPDPIGGSLDVYRHTRDQIDRALADLILFLRARGAEAFQTEAGATMKIAIGADHGGVELKEKVKQAFARHGVELDDVGTHTAESVDYPDFARAVVARVAGGAAAQGVLICKSGIGMSIAANKHPAIRAALCVNAEMAALARSHNDANILVLGAKIVADRDVDALVDAWLSTAFAGGRHERRRDKAMADGDDAYQLERLRETDPDIHEAIREEEIRQRRNLELIASENYTSRAVRQAAGSVMTNKYAEGYPGKRWYGGCECVDIAERLALERAKALFGADHANVQPHSGSQANMAVYFSVLNPGDTILAMNLAHGGHLTHGHKANFSGRFFQIVPYGVRRDTERIDYDELAELAAQHKPKLITAGASAYSRVIDFPRLRAIADACGAMLMVDMAHIAGLVAAGLHPSPVPHADFVTTTTHKTLRGPRGGLILCREKYAADVDKQMFPGVQGGPLMHIIAAKAVCFHEALQPSFRAYAAQVIRNAQALAAALVRDGLRICSGGTDNHLMLVDLASAGVTGKDAAAALDKASITVNKNAIPFDTKSPFVTSGIRLGTPAVTTRGLQEAEMAQVAGFIARVLRSPADETAHAAVRQDVLDLTARFPVP